MNFDSIDRFPKKIKVKDLVQSRYPGARPESWDERKEGVDVVRTDDGRLIKLFSDGQQSPPECGWILMLRSGDLSRGYDWTLYGMSGK